MKALKANKSTKKVASVNAEKASKNAKEVKKSQEAKQVFLCMNVKFEGNKSVIKVGETRDVRLKFVDEDNFLATEKKPSTQAYKDRKRTILARTVHGTMSADEYGVHIGFYFRHDEIEKNEALADVLESEAEEMGDRIVEMEAVKSE